ncbi:MAG TPA: DUF4874 domain-containing protein, partial [Candidatus Sulfotelmatobacter sp.]|nr:DUF4874 domain-containing protein [Candidatus Sulfotelmatobacter sp.]
MYDLEPCTDCLVYPDDPPPPPAPVDYNTQYLTFRGIRPDDPNGRMPLDNPERGFRFEFIMKAIDLKNPYNGFDYSNISSTLQAEEVAHGNEKIRLAQVYFYLTDYLKTPISSDAFTRMQSVFDQLKAEGVKVVLRFA